MKYSHKNIVDFYRKNKRMPSYSEIATLYKFKSKNAAYALVSKFIKEQFIKKDSQGFLIPNTEFNTPLQVLGTVQAGFPTFSSEEKSDYLSLDEWLVNDQDATYLLKVNGDSMLHAGILEGDYVIVERTDKFFLGDIVIAEISGDWTMKYLRQKNGDQYLQAANEDYSDIPLRKDFKLHAVVRSVVRKYETRKK